MKINVCNQLHLDKFSVTHTEHIRHFIRPKTGLHTATETLTALDSYD